MEPSGTSPTMAVLPNKRRAIDAASTSGSDSSDDAGTRRKSSQSKKNGKKKKSGHSGHEPLTSTPNGHAKDATESKAARDPHDEARTGKKAKQSEPESSHEERALSPVIDNNGLSRPSLGTRQRLEETEEEYQQRLEKMKGAVRTLLECIGEDPDREGLLDTPARYAKAMLYLTKGYQVDIASAVNNALFNEDHSEMVIVKDIELFSLCEHHLVPFTGKMHIGYIPSNTVIGLSKLPRIAEMFARRLQVQERLTKSVANALMEILKPQGVVVVMESKHLCMVMRGVEKTTTSTITSCVLGCFERKSKTRNEFFSLIGLNK